MEQSLCRVSLLFIFHLHESTTNPRIYIFHMVVWVALKAFQEKFTRVVHGKTPELQQ